MISVCLFNPIFYVLYQDTLLFFYMKVFRIVRPYRIETFFSKYKTWPDPDLEISKSIFFYFVSLPFSFLVLFLKWSIFLLIFSIRPISYFYSKILFFPGKQLVSTGYPGGSQEKEANLFFACLHDEFGSI